MKLRQNLGKLAMPLSLLRRAQGCFSPARGGFLKVLIYHDIPASLLSSFQNQIEYLSQRYRWIDLHTFTAMMENRAPITGGNLLLTFDDGFKSNRYVAEEILNPLGIRATFFILPDFINCESRREQKAYISKNIFNSALKEEEIHGDQKPMNWEDLKFLLDAGHSIGSHSRFHQKLSHLREESRLKKEILGSADLLEEKLGVPVSCFAYPFGDLGSIHAPALEIAQNRYRFIFSGIRGDNHPKIHPATLRREAISLMDSPAYICFMLEGGLSGYYYLDRKKLDFMAGGTFGKTIY